MKKVIITTAISLCLMACGSKESEKVTAMQKKDKNLTCREVLLEQNEAAFYKETAEKNKNPDVKSVLMPLGYISTYMSADEAVNAANARVAYLARIYEIMGCQNKIEMADRKNKLTARQMAETMDSSEDGTPVAPVVVQPAPQQMIQAMPQSYAAPVQPVMRPQPMYYQMPAAPQAQGPSFY